MSIIQAAGSGEVSTGFYKHLLDQSLKFDDGKSSGLKRTPASAGNQRLWTFSAWAKKSTLDVDGYLFGVGSSSTPEFIKISNSSTDQFEYAYWNGSVYVYQVRATALLRDTSAWYHIVLAVDTAQGTAANRVKFYVNGTQLTDFSISTYPTQNADTRTNAAEQHRIGSVNGGGYYDGYIAEVNFIDGTALTADSFGETKNGIWIPKDTSGLTFGTNGFHLTFKDDVVSEGFNAVTYTGTGAVQSISGIGFQPDFVWFKARSAAIAGLLYDSVRGATKYLQSNSTSAEGTQSNSQTSFDGDGFSVGADSTTGVNQDNTTYVAWCWEAGGTPTATNSAGAGATPTAGSVKIDGSNLGSALAGTIPATKISANTARGFSIVGYEATGTAGTIAHGLSAAPELIICKHRDQSGTYWPVYYGDNTDAMYLNDSGATSDDANAWNDTTPTSTVFSVGANGGDTNNSSGGSTIAYCFHSVSGYSKIGTFTGNGGSQAIDVGFEPAFVLMRRTSGSTWGIFDNLRGNSGSDRNLQMLAANSSAVETTNSQMTFSGNTFNDNGYLSDNGTTVLYMAFADTREAAFFKDVTTNGNHFVPVNLDYRDSVPDTPTNNFATFNPLLFNANVYSEGNLKNASAGNDWEIQVATMFPAGISGKWYAEFYVHTCDASGTRVGVGVTDANVDPEDYLGNESPDVAYYDINDIYTGGSKTADSNLTFAAGDIISVALNLDDGEVTFRKNNSTMTNGTQNLIASTLYTFATTNYGSGAGVIVNFGQDSSFAGNHATANSNADGNGHGSFAYAPPSGFLALCSQNLPDADIIDGTDNFNTVLYTGNGSTQDITTVGFSPDWVWNKRRDGAASHVIYDSVRGTGAELNSNNSNAEATGVSGVTAFLSNGYSLGNNGNINDSSETYASWNWLAGTAFSNDASATGVGTIDSEGQVNTKAGFSIVKYTGNGATGATVKHGLSSALQFYIIKNRDASFSWTGYHEALGAGNYIQLDSTGAASSTSDWNSTAPTSSVFTVSGDEGRINKNGTDYIAYCFHSVEGYSKVGSYTGNGNVDGPFVFTGFRPAWVMLKRSDGGSEHWQIVDNKRNAFNGRKSLLLPSGTNAEANATNGVDFLSNGFKPRDAIGNYNTSGATYIYLAFADQPFKFANAE